MWPAGRTRTRNANCRISDSARSRKNFSMWELMGTMHNFRPTLGTRKDPTSMFALAVSRRSSVLGPDVNSPGLGVARNVLPGLLDIFSRTALPPRPGKFIVAAAVATPCRDKSSVCL